LANEKIIRLIAEFESTFRIRFIDAMNGQAGVDITQSNTANLLESQVNTDLTQNVLKPQLISCCLSSFSNKVSINEFESF
jgi:hypothetical protein